MAGTTTVVMAAPGASVGEPDYGPLQGAQWVRDNAAPREVTDPGDGVTFTSRSDLATKIAANASGTTFVCAAGAALDWDAMVDVSTKAPKIYFLGTAGVDSAVIDGGSRQIQGIRSDVGSGGFEVHGGKFQNFGSSLTEGRFPLLLRGTAGGIWDAEFYSNAYGGFQLSGSDMTVSHVYTHDNGFYGCSVTTSDDSASGLTFEYVRISGNNTSRSDPGNTAGAVKFTRMVDGAVRYCYVHDNYGFGLWIDTAGSDNGSGMVFDENVCEDNLRAGIFLESAKHGTTARRNYLKGNGRGDATWPQTETNGWQLTMSCCDGSDGDALDISRNVVDSGTTASRWPLAIGIVTHDGHSENSKNISVTDNDIYVRYNGTTNSKAVGGVDSQSTKTMWNDTVSADPIVFDSNNYNLLSLSASNWAWEAPGSTSTGTGADSWATWQGFGFDALGTRVAL